MSYEGYPWWDCDENRQRDDCWPFQKRTKGENKEISKVRLMRGVQKFVSTIPSGWSVSWKVKRGHDLRVERSTKTIKAPFPKTKSGTAVLAVANRLANLIVKAEADARKYGGVPADSVTAFGFSPWRMRFINDVATAPLIFNSYDVWNDRLYKYGAAYIPYTHRVWRKASLAGAREVLRYLSSPHAWRVQRQTVKGPRLYRNTILGQTLIKTAAYRKALLDYLSVNDAHHPLPKRAKALMAKHVPVPQP